MVPLSLTLSSIYEGSSTHYGAYKHCFIWYIVTIECVKKISSSSWKKIWKALDFSYTFIFLLSMFQDIVGHGHILWSESAELSIISASCEPKMKPFAFTTCLSWCVIASLYISQKNYVLHCTQLINIHTFIGYCI